MKKSKVLLFASAVAALAACSSDEVVDQNNAGNEISFAPVINQATRGLDVTTAGLESFTVTAIKNGTTQAYFSNVGFIKSADGSFGSSPKYYWPATEALDFYAYATKKTSDASVISGQVNKLAYNEFEVTPSTDWNNQVDLVYAATKGKTKAANGSGVVLNFRHTGAKIRVKVKNTSETLKFKVSGWKVGFLSNKAKFTFGNDGNTDGQGSATLSLSNWGNYAAKSVNTQYVSSFETKNYNVGATSAELLAGEMILLPQETPLLENYASNDDHAAVTNPYIALNVIICNNDANETIVASGENGAPIWATWPLPTRAWEPGKIYTYVIDLAGGGYHPDNKPQTDPKLDPLLDEIKFVDVTVDEWQDGGEFPVTNN